MIKKITLTFCFYFSLCWSKISDEGLTTVEMIRNHDYPAETHYIKTEDGYILQIHRIPHGIKSKPIKNKKTMLLMHGMGSTSTDLVATGPERSICYILADLGYDVWIANARGNSYSRNHTTLDPNTSEKFWDFSWHEIGYYDLPAIIDYMLKETGDEAIYYIGHSQGTTTLLVLLSTRVEYNSKIKIAALLGTSAFFNHALEPLKTLASTVDTLIELCKLFKIYEMPPAIISVVRDYCKKSSVNPNHLPGCIFLMNLVGGGDDTPQIDVSLFPTLFTNAPNILALRQMFHYLQLVKNGRFHQYDYGSDKNLEIYGSETSPDYDLSLITAPIAIYSGSNINSINTYKDVNNVAETVSNLAENYIVPYELFNHVDFIFAKDVVKLFYGKLISDLAKF